jgi:hypothetical protein
VSALRRTRRPTAHLVTEANRPKSEDISYRERRYLIMMGVRVVCFVLAVVLVTQGAGWLAAIPAVGAIVIPYFAVVFANGGRELTSRREFQPYEPSLPVRYEGPPQQASQPGPAAPGPAPASQGTGTAARGPDSAGRDSGAPATPSQDPASQDSGTAWYGRSGYSGTSQQRPAR